jgi:predicted phage terminase large subunit-like protein
MRKYATIVTATIFIGAILQGGGAMAMSALEAKQAKVKLMQRREFLHFFRCYAPRKPYVFGQHTYAIIEECQAASDAIRRGESYYAIVSVPPRHGKSDIISRTYPVWHLLNNPDDEIIMASHTADVAEGMCMDALRAFKQASVDWGLASGMQRQNQWTVAGHSGKYQAMGLGGSITGKGANIFVVDDYLKSRIEAESSVRRDHLWDCFQSDLWTRRAPVHAFIIVATRWHVDDLAGRILRESERNPAFPQFKYIRFPAQADDGSYLFPERFKPAYYETQKAMGQYTWQSLFQNDPTPRRGNMLQADKVQWITEDDLPKGLQWRRGWDLASTEKQRVKDDPDFTVGTLAAFDHKARRLYVRDVVRGQWSALKRDKRMEETARRDAENGFHHQYIEAVGGYVDTFNRVRSVLRGVAVVRKATPESDKVARAGALEAVFEAGEVYAVKGAWNDAWQAELLAFPSGGHDDQVDSLVLSVYDQITRSGGSGITIL